MDKLRIGVAGCGRIAQLVHLNILARLPDVAVVALADPDAVQREAASRLAPGASLYADYGEMLRRADLEAVIICLPSALHAEAALTALEHGKHLYIEKPLASEITDGQAVLAAWRRAGVVGMIGFNNRFHAPYEALKRCVRENRIGKLIGVRTVFSTSGRRLPDWKTTRRTGGGVLLDLASHHIDLVRFIFGQEVREVFADISSRQSEGDGATLHLRLADGLRVQSFFAMNSVEEHRFEVIGEAGKLTLDRILSDSLDIADSSLSLIRLKQLGRDMRSLIQHIPDFLPRGGGGEVSYHRALAHFAAAARNECAVSPNLDDGYQSLAVICAAEESARTRRAIELSLASDEDSAHQ